MMDWVFFLMALVPLVAIPLVLHDGYYLPQVVLVNALSMVTLLLWSHRMVIVWDVAVGLAVAFLGYMALSSLWTTPPNNARKELGLQVPLLLTFIIGCAHNTEHTVALVCSGASVAALVSCIFAELQVHELDPIMSKWQKKSGMERAPVGTIGNQNWMTSYLCSTLWLSVYGGLFHSRSLLLITVAILYTLIRRGSRAGLISVFYSTLFLVSTLWWEWWFLAILIPLVVLIPFGVFALFWGTIWREPVDMYGPQRWFDTLRYRLCYWLMAWRLFLRRPLFGWGLWAYRREVYDEQAREEERHPGFLNPTHYVSPQPRHVHNDYLEHLVEFGVVGAGLFAAILGYVFYRGMGQGTLESLVLLSSLVCILTNALFFFPLRMASCGFLFWFTAAAIIVGSSRTEVAFDLGWLASLVFIPFITIFLWHTGIRRIVASRHFHHFMWSKAQGDREHYILKALEYDPHHSMYRSRAAMAFNNTNKVAARIHANKMLEHYDGMTVKYGSYYNAALAWLKSGILMEEVEWMLRISHWLNPYYKPTNDLLHAIGQEKRGEKMEELPKNEYA